MLINSNPDVMPPHPHPTPTPRTHPPTHARVRLQAWEPLHILKNPKWPVPKGSDALVQRGDQTEAYPRGGVPNGPLSHLDQRVFRPVFHPCLIHND